MTTPNRLPAALLRAFLLCLLPFAAVADDGGPPLDYRFQPPVWHTPLNLPGDWHKPMADQDGALVYDFGPGPYARPLTRVGFQFAGEGAEVREQTIVDARVPIVETALRRGPDRLHIEAYTLAPAPGESWQDPEWEGDVQRLNGLNHCLGWTHPTEPVDPAFRHVALATNRPLIYRLRVAPGSRQQVFLGFAEAHRDPDHWIKRIMLTRVEGAPDQEINVVDAVGRHAPYVLRFAGHDADGDGWLDVTVEAVRHTVDGNVYLNALWVFPPESEVDEAALARGELSTRATHYVDCGRDPQIQRRPLRHDVVHARSIAGDSPLQLNVTTRRLATYDEDSGELRFDGCPWIKTLPRPVSAAATDEGWLLRWPAGVREVQAWVLEGAPAGEMEALPDIGASRERLRTYWLDESGVPYGRIQVSDAAVQSLFDGCVRTMYQLAEYVDGQIQTQPGPSVYRGLWLSNQPRAGRALTHLGDFATARSSIDQGWRLQREDGRIIVLTPDTLIKETGALIHSTYLHARLSRDADYLAGYWPQLTAAGEWVVRTRRLADDPAQVNYQLMPAGMADGGVGGIVPEFTSVYWSRLGVEDLRRGAAWLGHRAEEQRWTHEAAAFASAYHRAVSRCLQQDEHGNWFLPIRMEYDPAEHVPQRAQTTHWHMMYPGLLLTREDPIAQGTMAMLQALPRAEGLLLSTGWLDGGVQPFIENIRAQAQLYMGDVAQAQATLYAAANHASPTHVWIEEHIPGEGPDRKATGDVPHSSAASEFINLVRYFLAMEDGGHLDLFKGVPASWLQPGAEIFMDDLPTEFGRLSLRLDVTTDGQVAQISVNALDGPILPWVQTTGGPRLHLGALKAAGFTAADGSALPTVWGGHWGEPITLNLRRQP